MDGNMVVLREPEEFAPAPGTDFVARAGEARDIASSGSDDKADYWHKLFTYPKEIKLGARHYEVIATMLRTPIASKFAGVYHQDKISLALTVQLLKLHCSHTAVVIRPS
jgi:hypothetical protein